MRFFFLLFNVGQAWVGRILRGWLTTLWQTVPVRTVCWCAVSNWGQRSHNPVFANQSRNVTAASPVIQSSLNCRFGYYLWKLLLWWSTRYFTTWCTMAHLSPTCIFFPLKKNTQCLLQNTFLTGMKPEQPGMWLFCTWETTSPCLAQHCVAAKELVHITTRT